MRSMAHIFRRKRFHTSYKICFGQRLQHLQPNKITESSIQLLLVRSDNLKKVNLILSFIYLNN